MKDAVKTGVPKSDKCALAQLLGCEPSFGMPILFVPPFGPVIVVAKKFR